MTPDSGHPLVTRARLLLLSALGAFVWLLLSLFGLGSSALASEGPSSGSLLDPLTETVEELSPVAGAIDEAIDPVIRPVANAAAAPPVMQAVDSPLETTLAVVDDVAQPVLDQPVISDSLKLADDLLAGPAGIPSPGFTLSIVMEDPVLAAPWAASTARPEPVAVLLTTAAADTRAAQVPAAGSTDFPSAPASPSVPVSNAPSASAQGGGGPSLFACLSGIADRDLLALAAAAPRNSTLPLFAAAGGDPFPD